MFFRLAYIFLTLNFLNPALAVERPGEELAEVAITANLGRPLSMELEFEDSSGKVVSLDQISEAKLPLIVVPVYYHCPRLCGLLLTGVTNLVNELAEKNNFILGRDYKLVSVSFNPNEVKELAKEKELSFKKKLRLAEEFKTSWYFWVDPKHNSKTLMKELGFGYRKDKQDFAHTAAVFVVNIQGKLSQYFAGIDFPSWDLKLALVDAAMGGVGSAIDQALLYCFRFDPLKGRYTFAISSLIKVVGALSILGIISVIVVSARGGDKTKDRSEP